jgi:DNA repair protein RecO (recombination protein O)
MVVVGSTDLGESDRIVRFLSAHDGRSSGLARRARASKKRFAGMLDLGTRLQVDLHQGKGSLMVITDLERVAGPDRARTELDRIALLTYGCEVCSALAPEHHPAPKLARLLEVWLDLLEGEVQPGEGARQALEAKALTFAGLTPALVHCSNCQEPLQGDVCFDLESGGGRHAWCGGGRRIDAAALGCLEQMRRTPLADVVNNVEPGATGIGRWLLSDFIAWHLQRPLRSRAWLADVLGAGPDHG